MGVAAVGEGFKLGCTEGTGERCGNPGRGLGLAGLTGTVAAGGSPGSGTEPDCPAGGSPAAEFPGVDELGSGAIVGTATWVLGKPATVDLGAGLEDGKVLRVSKFTSTNSSVARFGPLGSDPATGALVVGVVAVVGL